MTDLLNFAVITIFAREVLEGGIIIGEYRTVVLRSQNWNNPEMTKQEALREITMSALAAAAFALVLCVAIAIPLAVLSKDFNEKAETIVEGVSKLVASICILILSLKMPKFFGLYYSKRQLKQLKEDPSVEPDDLEALPKSLTKKSIRFNVAWNIWREVAECGVFLIPFFLNGEETKAVPLSALIGIVVGALLGAGIYQANKRLKSTVLLTVFTVALLVLLSTGLFTGGVHEFEEAFGETQEVWEAEGGFWSSGSLPMAVFTPFGYSDERTVATILAFWGWLLFSLVLHYFKYKRCRKPPQVEAKTDCKDIEGGSPMEDKTDEKLCSLEEEVGENDVKIPVEINEN